MWRGSECLVKHLLRLRVTVKHRFSSAGRAHLQNAVNHLPLELLTSTALSPPSPAFQGTEGGTYLALPVADTPPSTRDSHVLLQERTND